MWPVELRMWKAYSTIAAKATTVKHSGVPGMRMEIAIPRASLLPLLERIRD
jgi:hypothetical protein